MFFKLVSHSFLKGGAKKWLAICIVALSSMLLGALALVSLDVGDKMALEMKAFGANINLVPKNEINSLSYMGKNYNPLNGKTFLDERYLNEIKNIFWRNNIISYAPFLTININTSKAEVPFWGTYFEKLINLPDEKGFSTGVRGQNPYWKIKGRWPSDNVKGEILVGQKLNSRLNFQEGDRIHFSHNGKKDFFTIVGELSTGGPEDSIFIGRLEDVQNLADLPNMVDQVQISAAVVPENSLSHKARQDPDSLSELEFDHWYCTAYVSSVSQQIEDAVPNSTAKPIWKVAHSEGNLIKRIQLLMLVVTVATFSVSALGVFSFMNSAILERSSEIGLMKALGAEKEIEKLFHAEAMIIGVIAGIIGFFAGHFVAQIISNNLFGTGAPINYIVLPLNIVTSVGISLLGTSFAMHLLQEISISEVLHGK